MKRKLFLLGLLVVIASVKIQAQNPDPNLFGDWHPHECSTADGTFYAPSYYSHETTISNSSISYQSAIDIPFFDIVFSDPVLFEFEVIGGGSFPEGYCDGDPNCFDFLFGLDSLFAGSINSGEPLSYEIEFLPDGINKVLTITDVNGYYALYGTLPPLSINNYEKERVTIYPNPAQEVMYLKAETPFKSARIYSAVGALVMESSFTNEIDLSPLSPGLYIIEIASEYGNQTLKFIKS